MGTRRRIYRISDGSVLAVGLSSTEDAKGTSNLNR